MPETRLGPARIVAIISLAALTLGTSLGGSGRLTYHEAIVAQGAREMLARGAWLVPTLDGRPWLEKPPLAHWLVMVSGWLAGGVGEASARGPSALAAVLLVLGVATLAARRFGPGVGWLAGGVQATTAWTVTRGRLAEADILLACLVTWTIVALDQVREGHRPWRWAFFGLLGATALAKGIGFGGALVVATAVLVLAWDRDVKTLRSLLTPAGWAWAGVVALAWPLLVLAHHPQALGLWAHHVTDRLAARPEHFAGEPWWQYLLSPLGQTLPWAPLALVGAWRSWRRARHEPGGGDRLLWAWAVGPAVLVSLASVRNAHYLIHALPPWSIWAALGLARLRERLSARGWSPDRLRRGAVVAFAGLGLAWALGFTLLGPRFDRRGIEWAWYEQVGRSLPAREPLILLYDDWDRDPYPTPFGPVPHDLAVRLFYLDRPAGWRRGRLVDPPPAFAVVARDRDLPSLRPWGQVAVVARGPSSRWDRSYTLFRVTASHAEARRRPGHMEHSPR